MSVEGKLVARRHFILTTALSILRVDSTNDSLALSKSADQVGMTSYAVVGIGDG